MRSSTEYRIVSGLRPILVSFRCGFFFEPDMLETYTKTMDEKKSDVLVYAAYVLKNTLSDNGGVARDIWTVKNGEKEDYGYKSLIVNCLIE